MLTWKQQVADMGTTKSCAHQRSICNVESIGSINTPLKSVTYDKTNRHSQCILLTQRVFSFMFSPSITLGARGFFFRSEATIVCGEAAIVILAREKKKTLWTRQLQVSLPCVFVLNSVVDWSLYVVPDLSV